MAANVNKVLSGGKADGCFTKRLTSARTSVATISSPSEGADLVKIFEAGPNGGFVDEIGYQVVGTGTQAAFNLYIWITDENGENAELDPELSKSVAAGSAQSNTVMGQRARFSSTFQNLAAGRCMYSSISVLSTDCQCIVGAKGGQFETQ